MKKILIFIVAISLGMGETNAQINTYIKFLSYDTLAAAASCIASTPDGNYIISGTIGGQWALLGADGWFVKITPAGDTIWTRRIGGSDLDMLGTVIVNNDKYIAVGFKGVFLSGRQGWLLEYDANGNKLVDKTYGGSQDDALGDITPTGDGHFLALGQTKSFETDSTPDAWLVKFNSAFDTVWTKHYDLGVIIGDSSRSDNGNGIIPFGANKFLMTINTCKLCDGTEGVAWYSVIDSTGNIIGSPHVFKKGPKNVFAGGIRPTSDGGAIITGATSMIDSTLFSNFRSEDMWILKLNSSADTMWSKIYGKVGVYDGGFSIFQTIDGGYFMSAYSQIGDVAGSNYDYDNVWLMRLNSMGDTLKVCRWGGPNNDDLVNIIPASDGGAIGVGCYNSNSNPLAGPVPDTCDYMIIKTDCNIISGIPDVINPENNLNIFPNPSNAKFTLTVPSNSQQILIINSVGQIVQQLNDNIQTSYDFSLSSDGIYFIQVSSSAQTITKKLIICK